MAFTEIIKGIAKEQEIGFKTICGKRKERQNSKDDTIGKGF